MAQASFTDIKCGTPLQGSDLVDNIDKVGKAMGLSQTCIKDAQNRFTTGALSGSINIPFASMKAQASFTNNSDSMKQVGCGSFLVNAHNQLESIQNMKCLIKNNENNSSTTVYSNQKINFKTLPLSDAEIAAKSMIEVKALELAAGIKGTSTPNINLTSSLNKILDSYSRDFNISNSSIIQRNQTSISTLGNFSEDQISKIQEEYKKIADTIVKNNVEAVAGKNALDSNLKQVIKNNVQKNTVNASQNIQNTLNKLKAKSTSRQELNIEVPGSITIQDAELSQDILIDMATSLITQNAVKDGIMAFTDVVESYEVDSSVKTDNKGVDDLADSLGGINKAAIDSTTAGLGNAAYIAIAVIVAIIVIGGIFFVLKGGVGKLAEARRM